MLLKLHGNTDLPAVKADRAALKLKISLNGYCSACAKRHNVRLVSQQG